MKLKRSSSSSSTSVVVGEGERVAPPAGPAGGASGGRPPGSNTGSKLTTGDGEEVGRVKIDWLTLTYPAAVRPLVVAAVSEVMGEGEETSRGRNLYARSWTWATGAVLLFSDEGVNSDTCSLSLSAAPLDYFTPEALLAFMRWSDSVGAKCSRVDVAFDDCSRKVLRLDLVHAAAEAGNFAGFKHHLATVKKTRGGRVVGDSHTFGERGKNGGGRVVQFYDKTLQSKGEIDCVRMEARYSKKHAAEAFKLLVAAADLEVLHVQIAALIGGSIRFLDRSDPDEVHLDRMPPLPWWSAVLDLLGSVRIRVRRQAPPLQKSLEFHSDSWCLNVALLFEIAESQGLDGEAVTLAYLRRMVAKGKGKLDAGKKPGVKGLGLDIPRLLSA